MTHRVLVVEDDQAMAVALKDGFDYEGYDVVVARDGEAGLDMARSTAPDLMILDVMLPKMTGLEVCKTLRSEGNGVPIIMLTARGQEIDKVLGLKLGADDYVTKPFSFMELMARAEAVLRRAGDRGEQPPGEGGSYTFGPVVVDFARHEVLRNGEPVELSPREFRLLKFFIDHRGRVVSREELLDGVWGYETIPFTRTVDTHVAKLRKKIEASTFGSPVPDHRTPAGVQVHRMINGILEPSCSVIVRAEKHRNAVDLLELGADAFDVHRAVHHRLCFLDAGSEVDRVEVGTEARQHDLLQVDPRQREPRAVSAAGLEDHLHLLAEALESTGPFVDGLVALGTADTARVLDAFAVDDSDSPGHRAPPTARIPSLRTLIKVLN